MTEVYNLYELSIIADTENYNNLFLLDIDNWEEKGNIINIYIPKNDETKNNSILTFLNGNKIIYKLSTIQNDNWNKYWESNYDPILVDNKLYIRAHFHEPKNDILELIITPKMSFGTGHHATTYLCASYLLSQDIKNKSVIDFGTGTGILAILSKKLGATNIVATDYDEICIENGVENFEQNNCTEIKMIQHDATKENTIHETFDFIIANINRHILVDLIPNLTQNKKANTQLILSGILTEDLDFIKDLLTQNNWNCISHTKKDNWICIIAK